MEVVKIRLQAQQHSLADPLEAPKYRNAAHAVYTIVREEGFATLYRGVSLTALRQATNQGTLALDFRFRRDISLMALKRTLFDYQVPTSLRTRKSRSSRTGCSLIFRTCLRTSTC